MSRSGLTTSPTMTRMAAGVRLRAPSFSVLLAAAQRGDENAIAALWRAHRPAVLRYFRVAAPPVAEDLDAETWIEVAKRLSTFTGDEDAFRAFLFTVARHRLVDWRRRTGRRPEVAVGDRLPEGAGPDASVAVLQDVGTSEALRLLSQLSPDQAEAIALRVVAGLTVEEVGRLTGKKPSAVRVLCHRGLRRLAARIAEADAVEALA